MTAAIGDKSPKTSGRENILGSAGERRHDTQKKRKPARAESLPAKPGSSVRLDDPRLRDKMTTGRYFREHGNERWKNPAPGLPASRADAGIRAGGKPGRWPLCLQKEGRGHKQALRAPWR